jgi:hypothetical protein
MYNGAYIITFKVEIQVSEALLQKIDVELEGVIERERQSRRVSVSISLAIRTT